MTQALISIGSNLDKERNFPLALAALRAHDQITVLAVSPIFVTEPVGPNGQPLEPDQQPVFYNAALRIETGLDPAALQVVLRSIEAQLGRVRTADKFAPRPIDLDLAYYGRTLVEFAGRRIPDRDVLRFAHVAVPLAAIAPEWLHPETGETLATIAAALNRSATLSELESPYED